VRQWRGVGALLLAPRPGRERCCAICFPSEQHEKADATPEDGWVFSEWGWVRRRTKESR
jgi:hypothetical protein